MLRRLKGNLTTSELIDGLLWVVFSVYVLILIGWQQFGLYFNA